jgi:anti-sigma regulatory factor (Ser/Thr protein kinase)
LIERREEYPLPVEPLCFQFSVPAHPLSLGFVRRAMHTTADVFGPEIAETLALMFSELMTNAIRHSGVPENDPLEIHLEIGRDGIRGSVADRGTGFAPEKARRQVPGVEGGYGLRIVDRLSGRWGVDRRGDQSKVWFEL